MSAPRNLSSRLRIGISLLSCIPTHLGTPWESSLPKSMRMGCTPSPSTPEASSLRKRTTMCMIRNSQGSSLDSSAVALCSSELNTRSESSPTTRTSNTSVSPRRSLDDKLDGLSSSKILTTHSNILLVTPTLSPTSSRVARTLTRGWIPSYLALFYHTIFFLLPHPYTTPSPTLPERPI